MTDLTPTSGNAPGLHSTIRRNLLCAAPAALLAGAAMASETGLEDSPIMTLFREWQAGYDAMCADNDDDASVDHEHT